MSQLSIGELVRQAENNYITGTTNISEYVDFSLYDTINRIEAYNHSKHISGDKDSQGRERPFFNINVAARNIWYRATDIDRKNMRIKATKRKNTIAAFIATIHFQDWLRRSGAGAWLNKWGITLATYGSAVLKFVEKGDELHVDVVPWNRLICDAIDFDNNIKIEKLSLTPAELKSRDGYDQAVVDSLLDSISAREDIAKRKKDTKNGYITVYEVHGVLPLSLITGREQDEKIYQQQMHVVSFVANKKGRSVQYDDFTLIKGREKVDPYMLTHLIEEEGRVLGYGAVERLFESQWMVNHTAKSAKDQLDLASKLIFQTADPSFVGINALDDIVNGNILIHSPNAPLTQLNNSSHDITSLQNFGTQWQILAKEITSTPDAISGNTMPSGTAYRQVAILNQESHSLFEVMIENKGLDLEKAIRKYIIPHIKKRMDTVEEIAATLDDQGIQKFDSIYVPKEVIRRRNQKIIENALNDKLQPIPDAAEIEREIRMELSEQGNERFIRPSDIITEKWSDVLKDLEWDVEVEITGENYEKAAALDTLRTVFETIADPNRAQVLQTPQGKFLFNKILETSGQISSVELGQFETTVQMPSPQQAQQQLMQ